MKTNFSFFLFLVILICGCSSGSGKKVKTFLFPEERQIVSVGRGVPIEQWLSCDKVVIFQDVNTDYFKLITNWDEYIEKFSHVKFIFLVYADDERKIRDFMTDNKLLNFSVFWIQNKDFLSQNNMEEENRFFSFVVDKANKVIKLSNPTTPGFENTLSELKGC